MKKVKSGMRQAWHWWQKHISPGMFAVILTIILVAPLLFIGQVHGYADNGDFARAIRPNGIYPYQAANRSDYFGYVALRYHISHFFNETKSQVFSSQTIFIKVGLALNQLLFSRNVFNIRFMGVIYFVLFLGALYMLTQSFTQPLRRLRSYLIAIMVVLVFGDSAYTLYFNSFFAEPVGYIALLYAAAALLMLSRQHKQRRWPLVVLYLVSVIVLITSKQQNAPLALSFVLASCGLLFIPGLRRKWLVVGSGIAAVCIAGVATYAMISQQFSDINLFQTFSYGIMFESPDYTKELPKTGIDGQYALDRNEAFNPPAFAPVLPSDHATQQGLTNKLSTGWVVRFLLTHPSQFMRLLDVAAKNQMNVQPRAVGDYTKQSGAKSLQQVRYMTGYSLLAETFYPRKYMFNVLLAIALLIMCAAAFYQDIRRGDSESGPRLMLVAALLSIVIFVPIVSVIGDGTADLAKHLFLVPVSLNLIFTMLIADALTGRLWHTYRKEDDDEAQ